MKLKRTFLKIKMFLKYNSLEFVEFVNSQMKNTHKLT